MKKKIIQQEFRVQLGLIVDTPKQGSGNTNDGNTARRFFENPKLTAAITKVNENLIRNCKVILCALASKQPINAVKFGELAKATAEIYKKEYHWRKMSATFHKILCHGEIIVQNNILPLGELSEEAQESKNKDYRHFRLHNTRKSSRINQNEDLIMMLLLSSDPYISQIRQKWNKAKVEFHKDDEDLPEILKLFESKEELYMEDVTPL